MARLSALVLLISAVCASSGCEEKSKADPVSRVSSDVLRFDQLLAKYPDLTFQQLVEKTPQREYVEHLTFDPSQAKYYDETVKRLQLTEVEQKLLRERGFVSVDHDQPYSFGSMYYAIFTNDLPVLVTTDSILYAMHRTYDDILMDLEQRFISSSVDVLLDNAAKNLAQLKPQTRAIAASAKDVDLYLTVARNLLHGAGAPQAMAMAPGTDTWSGSVLFPSQLGQDDEVLKILKLVQSQVLQLPGRGDLTIIYGGKRAIDYSQFQPRGHYLKSAALSQYFRAMTWLGRADTGWNILPVDPQSGIASDSERELRDAVLLTQVLQSSGGLDQLRQVSDILDFLVGESDNLTIFQLAETLRQQGIHDVGDVASSHQINDLQDVLRKSDLATQRIRSQVVLSDPQDLYQVPPPAICQLLGQRSAVDSFVLSKVVYDSIIFQGQKVRRKLPTGLDVMFALGNETALPLLAEDMNKSPYAANLKASQDFVARYQPPFWQGNLYNIWLDALRTLSADVSSEKHFPQAMRTAAWQRKQLQAQLASWAELRHDNVLYTKQSYGARESCDYPSGYVEPYPETYARIKFFAEEAARRIGAANFNVAGHDNHELQQRQVKFLEKMARSLARLEDLARKELAAEPFTEEDQAWMKRLIVRSGMCGGPPYSGWYSDLFYGGPNHCHEWKPTVVDVHTDPDSQSVLEEGVGSCNFMVVAVDSDDDHMIYVGPAYSYYEFQQPAANRLTDELWSQMLSTGKAPPRPSWVDDFQAPSVKRSLDKK